MSSKSSKSNTGGKLNTNSRRKGKNTFGTGNGKPSPNKGKRKGTITPREKLLVLRYLTHWNAKRAAIEVGLAEQSAAQQASTILKKPRVVKFIDEDGDIEVDFGLTERHFVLSDSYKYLCIEQEP